MAEGNWKTIAAKIAAQIESGELAPGTRLPSGDALARSMDVNRNVVHRALEELQRGGLVVRRQGSGTLVTERSKKSYGRIALLVDGYSAVHNFPSGDLLRGIQDRIGEEKTLLIADSKHDPALEARHFRRLLQEADGILLYACAPDRSAALSALLSEGYPVVAIDRLPQGVSIDTAVTDNRGTVQHVVTSLIEGGHRQIGFLGLHKPTYTSVMERHEGYCTAMSAAGFDPESLVRWLPEGATVSQPIFERIIRDTILGLRHEAEPITALFCVEDCLGCAAVVACDRLGLDIPSDLEIATFIDWHPMTLTRPWNVRRIVQRKYELGYAAADLLLDRIASPSRPPKSVRIGADINTTDVDFQESASLTATKRNPTNEGHFT